MDEENTIEYFQTTLEMLKDKGEIKVMLTSTFVLYDIFLPWKIKSKCLTEAIMAHRARNTFCILDERHLLTPAYISWNSYMPHSSLKRYEVKTLLVGSANGLGHEQRLETEKFPLPKWFYQCSKGDFGLAEGGDRKLFLDSASRD